MKEAMYELIKANEGLIYKIASRYTKYYNIEDLYQVGSIGIIKAYKKYRSESGAKFSTYAYKYVLGEIIDFIRKDRNIIVSEEYMNIYRNYIKIKELLFTKYEREPSFSEIASFMEISENELLFVIESVMFTCSNEVNKEFTYEGSIDDRENIFNKILIESELSSMEERDRMLIDYRYYQGYSQSETASLLGMSQAKVSRNEKLILSKMKKNIA